MEASEMYSAKISAAEEYPSLIRDVSGLKQFYPIVKIELGISNKGISISGAIGGCGLALRSVLGEDFEAWVERSMSSITTSSAFSLAVEELSRLLLAAPPETWLGGETRG